MKTATPLSIEQSVLEEILKLSKAPRRSPDSSGTILAIIYGLDDHEKRDLLALYMLGNAGYRSFNVARKAADGFPVPQITSMFEEKANLYKPLAKGLSRYRKQA